MDGQPFSMPVSGFDRAARRACDQCGAPVRWTDGDSARAHGMNVEEAVSFMGVPEADMQFWVCTKCDQSGVMGPPQFGF
jgi:hypothetical protein